MHRLITARDNKFTNFVEFRTYKVIYRRYAGLFFSFCVDTVSGCAARAAAAACADGALGQRCARTARSQCALAAARACVLGALFLPTLSFFFAPLDFCQADNELAYLEAIHLFVMMLDEYFGNVCELDLVFNFHKVYAILDEYIVAGELQETSHGVILDRLKELEKAMM